MKEINIEIPKGYIIDTENSDLTKGIIKFKKIGLPKTWEDYFESLNPSMQMNVSDVVKLLLNIPCSINKKYTALFKLELLRNRYRQGWKPDYTLKYGAPFTIFKSGKGDLNISELPSYANHFLSFQNKETCKLFIDNFKNLIIEAEDLI